jgi:hypothetical protein
MLEWGRVGGTRHDSHHDLHMGSAGRPNNVSLSRDCDAAFGAARRSVPSIPLTEFDITRCALASTNAAA